MYVLLKWTFEMIKKKNRGTKVKLTLKSVVLDVFFPLVLKTCYANVSQLTSA